MVVIRDSIDSIVELYGSDSIRKINEFSTIIGYSVERENGELKVEFNPDRPDLFSFVCLINAIEVYLGSREWQPLNFSNEEIEFNVEDSVVKLRPIATGFHAKGLKIGKKLHDLIDFQERIHQSIGKNRSKVSIGIHDIKRIKAPLNFRAIDQNSIIFTTYDGLVSGTPQEILNEHPKGIEYSALIPGKGKVPIIVDARNQVLSLPPVINGNVTTVTGESSDFFVDITGTDKSAVRDAFYLLAYYFQVSGYSISPSRTKLFHEIEKFDRREIAINSDSIQNVIGAGIPTEISVGLLKKMGYKSEISDMHLVVEVPGNRVDVMGEVDIIEDIAKAHDYQNITPTMPAMNIIGKENSIKQVQNEIRGILVGLGYQETMSYVVTTDRFFQNQEYEGGVEVLNPKSSDFSMIRDKLYPGVIDFLRINKRRNLPQRIFELGDVIQGLEQSTHLCVAIANSRARFSDIKQVLDALSIRLGYSENSIEAADSAPFIPGRSGFIILKGRQIGIIGEIHPEYLEKFEMKNPVSLMELDVGIFQESSS